jgi:anti-sigma regulatory factor (Ser/Thr protein kinase)/predicted transcriptional regulator
MTIEEKTLKILSEKQRLTTRDIVLTCKVSRQYANIVLRKLTEKGFIVKIGSTRSAFYISPQYLRSLDVKTKKTFRSQGLEEHEVYNIIEKQLYFSFQFTENIRSILFYAFTEMLNNAIVHSNSELIKVEVEKKNNTISFVVNDFGIGVFKNVMKKRNLNSELEAIQDLLKGKTTTQPQAHSGEGIFFTSKIADLFILESFGYRLRVDNTIKDTFIEEVKPLKKGTKVFFSIDKNSTKHLNSIFEKYQTGSIEFGFDRTEVKVKLFSMGTIYVSRSQAKRVLVGLDKFKSIIFDFDKVPTIGQAFVDEIFRVFANTYPEIKIQAINTNKVVQFMIDRVHKDTTGTEEKTGRLL